jgi:hypothetical protein
MTSMLRMTSIPLLVILQLLGFGPRCTVVAYLKLDRGSGRLNAQPNRACLVYLRIHSVSQHGGCY